MDFVNIFAWSVTSFRPVASLKIWGVLFLPAIAMIANLAHCTHTHKMMTNWCLASYITIVGGADGHFLWGVDRTPRTPWLRACPSQLRAFVCCENFSSPRIWKVSNLVLCLTFCLALRLTK